MITKLHRVTASLVAFFLLLAFGSASIAQAQEAREVQIASGGHIVHFLPLDLAVAKGFFEDEGLDPQIQYVSGGTETAQTLLSGQVQFSMNSIDHAYKAAVQGKENLRMVVLLNQTPGMVLVVDSDLKDSVSGISDLAGLRLGVTSKGSATHSVLAFLLDQNGVSPDNVTVVNAGASTFPSALRADQIDGGIALEPFASALEQQGDAFVLRDLTTVEETKETFGGPYNQAGLLTTEEVIRENPGLVQKVVSVHQRALEWLNQHSPTEIANALPTEVTGSDKERYIRTLKELSGFYSEDGYINPEGAQNVLRAMKLSGALSTDVDLVAERYYTNRFVKSDSLNVKDNGINKVDGNSSYSKLMMILIGVIGVALVSFFIYKGIS